MAAKVEEQKKEKKHNLQLNNIVKISGNSWERKLNKRFQPVKKEQEKREAVLRKAYSKKNKDLSACV